MNPLILLGIAAGLAAVEWLRTYRGREISLRPGELRRGPAAPGDEWAELCNVDDVSVLSKFRPNAAGGGPHLRLQRVKRHRSMSLARVRGRPQLVFGPPQPEQTLFEAAPWGWGVAERVESGDPAFDSQVVVGGSPLRVRAALDHETRQFLMRLFDGTFAIDDRGVVPVVSHLAPRQIFEKSPELMRLARSVSPKRRPEEHRAALLRNFRQDPVPDVRRRNLKVLLHEFSGDPVIGHLANDALASSDLQTRLIVLASAAHRLDPAVVNSSLLDLARGQHAVAIRVQAIELLGQRHASIAKLRPELTKLLRDGSEQVRTAAFELLSARGWVPEDGTLALAPSEGGEISLSGSSAPDTEREE